MKSTFTTLYKKSECLNNATVNTDCSRALSHTQDGFYTDSRSNVNHYSGPMHDEWCLYGYIYKWNDTKIKC